MTTFDQEYAALDAQQRAAVDHVTGNAVVCAAAGSGKTRVLTMRIWSLVVRHNVDPERICACAFGKDAATEIGRRLHGYGLPETFRVGTVHSLCYEVVRTAGVAYGGGFQVSTDDTLHYAVKDFLSKMRIHGLSCDLVETFIAKAKAYVLPAVGPGAEEASAELGRRALSMGASAESLLAAYKHVESVRQNKGLLTFDDMPMLAAVALSREELVRDAWKARYDHVLVDEAQDLTPAQYQVLDAVAGPRTSTMLVGDGAQSIYGFRNVRVGDFLTRVAAAATRYANQNSYRCPPSVCEVANRLTAGASWNVAGEILPLVNDPRVTTSEVAYREYASSEDEAAAIATEVACAGASGRPWSSFVVLYRATSLLRAVESAFVEAQVPYVVLAGPCFYDRMEVRDLLAYLQVVSLADPDSSAARRIVNRPFRYLGKAAVSAAEAYAVQNGVAFLDGLMRGPDLNRPQKARRDEFIRALRRGNKAFCTGASPRVVLEGLLNDIEYIPWLEKDGDGSAGPGTDRVTNVFELVRLAGKFGTIPALLEFAAQAGAALRDARTARSQRPDVVAMSTIHGFKGLEADTVYLVGLADGFLPLKRGADQEEEKRLFYVALTRARQKFVASYAREVATSRGILPVKPSPFVAAVGLTVEQPVQHVRTGDGFTRVFDEMLAPRALLDAGEIPTDGG